MDSKEEWRAMKVIVLGRIGKTSLTTRLHEIFNKHENQVYKYNIKKRNIVQLLII